eukprot:CAMPEP_0175467874 /NCGR_PEP_ID=MMETSP0095-20121207/71536_1 /TAXON_ID=311494 /ORGANISM="Alexandrium monilatum, Strain CCMP3105" /LENGTH=64 /DNA_ID=CAMNT_0016769243 /DNA_START=115 /DNA_END=305 /DNA_ORIENTATION=-
MTSVQGRAEAAGGVADGRRCRRAACTGPGAVARPGSSLRAGPAAIGGRHSEFAAAGPAPGSWPA